MLQPPTPKMGVRFVCVLLLLSVEAAVAGELKKPCMPLEINLKSTPLFFLAKTERNAPRRPKEKTLTITERVEAGMQQVALP
jgi:hypothetical protein